MQDVKQLIIDDCTAELVQIEKALTSALEYAKCISGNWASYRETFDACTTRREVVQARLERLLSKE